MDLFISYVLIVVFLFLLFVIKRLYYIKGYRAGARMVLSEWKQELKEEGTSNDEHI